MSEAHQRRASDICPESKSSVRVMTLPGLVTEKMTVITLTTWCRLSRDGNNVSQFMKSAMIWAFWPRRLLSFYPTVQNCYFRRFFIFFHLSSSFGAMGPSHVIDDADVHNRQSWCLETKETIETTKPITVIWFYKAAPLEIKTILVFIAVNIFDLAM